MSVRWLYAALRYVALSVILTSRFLAYTMQVERALMMFASGKFVKDPEDFDGKGWKLRTDAYTTSINDLTDSRWISLLTAVRLTLIAKDSERRRRFGPPSEEKNDDVEMPPSDPESPTTESE
jgi:hypothetical protein